MSLFDSLSKISEQIQSQRHLITSEQATILVSIQPFIRALGYDTQNLAEVQPEYTADAHSSGTERVDYVIKRDSKPIILIEVKSAETVLNKYHWKQLHNYFVALDVEFGVLTNGIEYRFYTDLKKRNVMDEEPFLAIDMRNLDPSQINALEGFSKSRYAPDQTVRKIKISNLLEQELNQPSDDFVKHFARQVHSGSLFQSVIQEFRPLVKRAWDDLVDQEIARRLRRYEELEDSLPELQTEPEIEKPAASKSPGDAVEIPIFAVYKGRRFEATFLLYEEVKTLRKIVRYEGEVLSPSRAGLMAQRTILPSKKSLNGWTFWMFRDAETNQDRYINDLFNDPELVRRLHSKG